MISYPLVGQLPAAGLTVQQLAEKLRAGLNRDLVDPVVTLSLREASKHALGRVSLLGAVRSPGGCEIKEGTTLAEALASSGGPRPPAHPPGGANHPADRSPRAGAIAPADRTGGGGQNTR